MTSTTRVWRLGHASAPLQFTPRELCSWNHRFDDPRRAYRTLYVSEAPITCLREVLADLRPNAEAIAEFSALFGDSDELMAGTVSQGFREKHVLAEARLAPIDGQFVDVEEPATRERLKWALAPLLRDLGLQQLDLGEVRGNLRTLTKAISRHFYDQGSHGLSFRSKLDDGRCWVCFEGRSHLEPAGSLLLLTTELPDLLTVCREYHLKLEA